MTRKRYERKKNEKAKYLNDVSAASSWHQPKTPSRDRKYIEEQVASESGLQPVVVKRVMDLIFGVPRLGVRGVIQRMVDSGQIVHINGFGQFGQRMRKGKITNDISRPGTMTYTPTCSTVGFKPDKSWYWDHYAASISANMPDKPLPPNMHFSQRVTSMPFYRDWQEKMAALCDEPN